MAKHRQDDTHKADKHGRTRIGRARDAFTKDDDDHGAPHQVKGSRADRRASREQIITTNIFGRTKVHRGGRSGELRDRW